MEPGRVETRTLVSGRVVTWTVATGIVMTRMVEDLVDLLAMLAEMAIEAMAAQQQHRCFRVAKRTDVNRGSEKTCLGNGGNENDLLGGVCGKVRGAMATEACWAEEPEPLKFTLPIHCCPFIRRWGHRRWENC